MMTKWRNTTVRAGPTMTMFASPDSCCLASCPCCHGEDDAADNAVRCLLLSNLDLFCLFKLLTQDDSFWIRVANDAQLPRDGDDETTATAAPSALTR